MSKIHKHRSMDKYDGYMPNKAHWIHNDYHVSMMQEMFHTASAYGYHDSRRHGFSIGIEKKMWKASGYGINIDSEYVGKSDNS